MQELKMSKPQLTSREFETDEQWVVKTGKETYHLSGAQAQKLKEMTTAGLRGLVWFDTFAISIPYITSISRKKRGKKEIERKVLKLRERVND